MGWAVRLATAALGTGIQVQQILPGEILKRVHPERFRVLDINFRQVTFMFVFTEKYIQRRAEYVPELGKRNVSDKAYYQGGMDKPDDRV